MIQFNPLDKTSEKELAAPPPGTLWECFEVYAALRLTLKSRESWRIHILTLRWFDKFLDRYATPADLNEATVKAFWAWLRGPGKNGQPRAEATARAIVERLLAFWTFCAHAAYVAELPTVKRVNRWERDGAFEP